MGELQPDIAGYMASLGSTNEPLEICASCQRALLYGAMMYAGSIKGNLDKIRPGVTDPVDAAKALKGAMEHSGILVEILAEFIRADFVASLPGAEHLTQEDWGIAIASFFEARTQHYVSEDGKLIFEPHDSEGGEPEEVLT